MQPWAAMNTQNIFNNFVHCWNIHSKREVSSAYEIIKSIPSDSNMSWFYTHSHLTTLWSLKFATVNMVSEETDVPSVPVICNNDYLPVSFLDLTWHAICPVKPEMGLCLRVKSRHPYEPMFYVYIPAKSKCNGFGLVPCMHTNLTDQREICRGN